MVTLDYKLSTDWNHHEMDLRCADELALRYDAFPGDIVFRVGEADFSAQWGWVPVLDFALALETIAERLEGHDRELFEFTESGATIEFQRNGGPIEISASYTQSPARLPLFELTGASEGFLARLRDELPTAYAELSDNEYFAELTTQ